MSDLDLRLDLWVIKGQDAGDIPNGALRTEDAQYLLTEDGFYLIAEDGVGMPKFSELTEATTVDDNDVFCFGDPDVESFKINRVNLSAMLSPFFQATELDEGDVDYVYYGGTKSGDWKINRFLKIDGTRVSATEVNNPGTVDLASAWTNRGTLIYS